MNVKEFLNLVKKEDSAQYFRLYKFYKNPAVSLGGTEEKTLESYYQHGEIKNLIANNIFFQFLDLCLREESFVQKLDFILLRKIRFLLYDSKVFKEEYLDPLEDPYLRNWCSNKVPIGEYYSKKYNKLELWSISLKYQELGWIYELGLGKEIINDLDLNLIRRLLSEISFQIDVYYERYVKPIEDRKILLDTIRQEDYSASRNCFLESRDAFDKRVFKNLVCDNDFLDIVEETLLPKDLPKGVITNIISILEVSVDFKTLNIKYEDFQLHYQELGKERIASYNYQRAIKLISELKKKEHLKVIIFQKS